ncbi:Uncharacterised protein [Jonesia denitrificans]|nr:Uncharacterised protein [Jonesia denitrificans]
MLGLRELAVTTGQFSGVGLGSRCLLQHRSSSAYSIIMRLTS